MTRGGGRGWPLANPQRLRRQDHRGRLTLVTVQGRLAARRQDARAQDATEVDGLARLRRAEGTAKRETSGAMRTVPARWPSHQPLESCDGRGPPAVDRQKRQALATCRGIAPGDTVVFLGPPGTGKPMGPSAWA